MNEEEIKDMVFFAKEDTEGVKLTSTSANHIANMAKEYIQGIETRLANIQFIGIEVGSIGEQTHNTIQMGCTKEEMNEIPSMLEQVAKAKSLIAWLREAIKAKDKLLQQVNNKEFKVWCLENGVEDISFKETGSVLTEEEYYASLPIKQRNRYFQLETIAAVIGKYIHPNGILADARKELKDKRQHPYKVNESVNHVLIYKYLPTVQEEDVDKLFYELQSKHREIQSELNSMKHDCEMAIEDSRNKVNLETQTERARVNANINIAMDNFRIWKDTKGQEYRTLKIVIPNSLMDIYSTINALGKK